MPPYGAATITTTITTKGKQVIQLCNPYVPIGTKHEKHTKNRVRLKIKRETDREREKEILQKMIMYIKSGNGHSRANAGGQVGRGARGKVHTGLVTAIGLVGCSKAGERVVCFPFVAQVWSCNCRSQRECVCVCVCVGVHGSSKLENLK